MNNRVLENMLIVTLIGIILCLLFPIVQKIVLDADKKGAEASANASIASVQLLFIKENKNHQLILPFTVDYNEQSYNVYVNGEEYSSKEQIETKGRRPIGGSISIMPSGIVIAVNLKYKTYTCNKSALGEVECLRNSN